MDKTVVMDGGDGVSLSGLTGVLWFILALLVLFTLRRQIRLLLATLSWRLRSGASLKVGSVELGAVHAFAKDRLTKADEARGIRLDKDQRREKERAAYYEAARGVMLVHKLFCSNRDDQAYDILIYVVPHKRYSLAAVTKVEYFFGSYWGSMIFPSTDRSRGFSVVTSAYGPFLCTAEVFFNDGKSVFVHRFIDFEMGAFAPALVE